MKIEQLAIVSGTPAFKEPLHVGRPNLPDRGQLHARLDEMLDRRWLTNDGPFVQRFERSVAELLGVKHCIATANGTLGLELGIVATGMSGEVIVPSFTFAATVHALHWLGLTPVFCDIDPESHNIDPAQVEKLITPRTSGIIGVHVWGRACDTAALEQIARDRKLSLLFDSAHAFACSHRSMLLGNFGDAEVFSFHATKFVSCGEGGAVVTNDDSLAERLRLMRNFGFRGNQGVVSVGINAKMSELAAILGLGALESINEYVEINRSNYLGYQDKLRDIPGVRPVDYDPAEQNNYQYVVVEIDSRVAGLTRDLLVNVLLAENVLARRYFYPGCHRMEPYRSLFPEARHTLRYTEAVAERVAILPTGTAIDIRAIEKVCRIVASAVEHSGKLNEHCANCPTVTPATSTDAETSRSDIADPDVHPV